jgi:quercetin 2,3-dioxygenase
MNIMIRIRKAGDRGVTQFGGWLDSRHTFSFGDYRDPEHHHYRSLRVINDDRVAPGGGFPTHPHRDMEILTCVLQGELAHKDSMGHGSSIMPGEWQKMTAGTGVTHSEYNPSAHHSVHLLQIWIMPDRKGLPPAYEQKSFPAAEKAGKWCTVASPDGRAGSLTLRQDAVLSAAVLQPGEMLHYEPAPGRGLWLHAATGAFELNGQRLEAGDAAAIEGETLNLRGIATGEVLLFDLA